MSKKPKAPEPEDDEATGRKLFGWLERPGASFYVILVLAAAGLIALFFDTAREPSAGGPDRLWGFYAIAGAIGLTGFVLLGKGLLFLLGRDADYYEVDDERP